MRETLIALALMLAPAAAYADTGTDLKTLVDDYWAAVLKESPRWQDYVGMVLIMAGLGVALSGRTDTHAPKPETATAQVAP